VQKVC